MKFVRLRLQGFKSFVDAAEAPIEAGLTGVVGPNGCGKSNLLEAIRWAMGETSAKAMRGAGMDDVIFAGAASRPARAFAEVALTLDNSLRRAPPGFNDADTLEVVRRIARDAGSNYRINGREARARDVRMLFADAATGAHSPALVRQGRISELVNAKPSARRAILEEAAGVSGLHQRRHEAELKLDATARNLTRVDEVLEGLETRLAQLSRQAREAARYRRIAEDLRRAELGLALAQWRAADAARAAADAALTAAATEAARLTAAATAAAAARAQAADAAPPAREEAAVAAAIVQRAGFERDRLEAQAKAAQATLEDARARLEQIEADRAREAVLNADALDSLKRLDAEIADIERARAGRDAEIAAAEAAAQEAETRRATAEAEAAAAGETAATAKAEREVADRAARETAAARDAAEAAASKAADAAAQGATAATEARARAAAAAEAAAAAAEALTGADADASGLEAARAAAMAEADAARAAAAEVSGAAAALRSELAGVEKMLASGAAKGPALLDAVRAAPGWEAALGAALGDDLSQPEARADAGGWIDLAPDAADAPPPGAQPLAPHVQAPARLARRLARVAVAPDAATGDALQPDLPPGWRLVDREGALWRWDGLRLRPGDAPNAAAARLALVNRRDALQAELAVAAAQAERAAAADTAAKAALADATAREKAAREARRRAETAAAETARAQSRDEAAAALAEDRRAALDAAAGERAAAAETAQRAAQAAADAQAAAGDPSAAADAALAARRRAEDARGVAASARASLEEVRRRDAGRARRLEAAGRERATWARRLASAESREAEMETRRARAAAAAEAAEAAPARIAATLSRLGEDLAAARARAAAADDALATAEAAAREAETAARDAETAAGAAREARARAEAVLEADAARAAEALERLRALAPDGPEAAMARYGAEPPAADAAEIDVAKLTRQRDALGAVNLRAEADAAEVTAERDALAAERADLQEAIDKLRTGVAELNREGRARLIAAFDEVDATFRNLFQHLFGGGEARLELVESDDPLQAGLEIAAMPPGKRLSSLSLMSGGEQTLTALALIFAVFLVNPAPICVLDEVDAPLDDANVGRFCDLLDEMTRRTDTRFLVITHNAVTMSRMDRLFGVTMVEQGVSQLVSVDLALAAEMAAS